MSSPEPKESKDTERRSSRSSFPSKDLPKATFENKKSRRASRKSIADLDYRLSSIRDEGGCDAENSLSLSE